MNDHVRTRFGIFFNIFFHIIFRCRWRINKNITVEVVSREKIELLHYLVISHGRIRVANTVRIPQRKYQVVKFVVTIDLVPSANFIAYYFKDGQIRAKRKEIKLEEYSNNFIKMKLSSEQLQAGDNVTIDVQTNPKSYVGLLAIDQSVLLLKSGNDLAQSDIVNELNAYGERAQGLYSGSEKDFLVFFGFHSFLETENIFHCDFVFHYFSPVVFTLCPASGNLTVNYST